MKYVTIAAVVAILLAGAIAEGEQAQGAAQAEKTRVAKSTGKPIAEQVRPDDQRVVLEINALPPLLVNPPKSRYVNRPNSISPADWARPNGSVGFSAG